MWFCASYGIFLPHSAADGERKPKALREEFYWQTLLPAFHWQIAVTWLLLQARGIWEMPYGCTSVQKEIAVSATATYSDFVKHCPGQRSQSMDQIQLVSCPFGIPSPTHYSQKLRKFLVSHLTSS